MEPFFDHERLDVYRLARELNREIHRVVEDLPRGQSESRDNLRRAAKSVTRHIAEGAGKWTIADKVNYCHMARASAMECAASLDELVDHELIPQQRIHRAREILGRVVAMLIGMVRSLEARGSQTMGG